MTYTDEEIFDKLKEILGICCPDLDISTIDLNTNINRDKGIDSLNFIMIMTKVESAYDIRIPDEEWDKLSTPQDVIDKVQEQLAAK